MSCEIGKIKTLRLKDFLTYDELQYVPGKNLNIIIGPNGTGKSTIVAGIILGCGGKPALLSRSKEITDFIKNGKNKAQIEIELKMNEHDDQIVVFHRSFDKTGKESYSIEGTKVSAKAYIERIRTYHIQVDNLCMFLPQDRVQDFTKLNPQELLQNTQISVCNEETNDAFEALKKKRELQKSAAKHNAEIQVQLTDNVNRNEQLHTMIENNRAKEKLIKERELHLKKKAWLQYDVFKKKYDEVSADVTKLQEVIGTKKNELKPLEKKQQEIAGSKTKLKNDIITSTQTQSAITAEVERMVRDVEKINIDIRQTKQDLKDLVQSRNEHEKEMRELQMKIRLDQQQLAKMKQEMEMEGDVEAKTRDFDEKTAQLKRKFEGLHRNRLTINTNLEEKVMPAINATNRKIASISDSKQKRFQTLRNHFEDAYKASDWLRTHRDQFNGQIFNPLLTEITVTDKKYAKYVENCIGNRDLESFLCTDKEDMSKLIKILRNDMKLKVNVGFTEQADELLHQAPREINQFPRHHGIYAYLIDMIEGPAPLLNYLCKLYGLHNIVIGDDRLENFASQLPADIKVFFSTNTRFQVTVSRYSGNKSVQSNDIMPRNLIDVSVDEEELNNERQKLQRLQQSADNLRAERAQMENQMKEIESQRDEVRAEKTEALSKTRAVSSMESAINRKQKELENLTRQRIDIQAERRKIREKNDLLVEKLLKAVAVVNERLMTHKECTTKRELAKKKLRVFDDSTGNVDDKIDEVKRNIRELEYALDNAKRDSHAYETRMISKRREALDLTDNIDQSAKNFPYKKKFEKLPQTVEELEDKILEMQGRIECIRGVDPAIVEEYERRKETIERLNDDLHNEQARAMALENELKNLHQTWYPQITSVVNSINENFSNFFAKMGFVGEVELVHKEERDYADYGIVIRVQYRDSEKLQALNRHIQSGGERAVAIAVYTLSLQHLTTVPFRCVDEINQGMDPKNERKIFQMLVDITCKPGQSQYFFVTPKLLPDLPYSDLMTITVVHNGKHIEDPYVFDKIEADNSMEI